MAFKVAVIGAGSGEFTQSLISDLLQVPEFGDIEIALMDINAQNLERSRDIVQTIVDANGLGAKVVATTDRREALNGARYIMNCVRVGGLETFATDVNIPLKYGVDQCVGDTLCAGGIMYGQRNIPVLLDFCKDIREVSETNAMLMNYANPMAINTWAADQYGGVRAVGLCHGVQGGALEIAEALGTNVKELDYICSGINHQTWFIDIRLNGRKVEAEELIAGFERHPRLSKSDKLRIDMLKRFGYFSTESNGHLSEYLPWYRKGNIDQVSRWIDLSNWINGETGGYLRYSTERQNWFAEDFHLFKAKAAEPLTQRKRSVEHASYMIEGMETGRVYRGHFNVRNNGAIANLPEDAIIESSGFVDRFGINMIEGIKLPTACATTCSVSIGVQRLAVEAAMTGNIDTLKLAVLHDPLVGAICTPDEVWAMVDEMVVAQEKWLPQYADAIPAARERVAKSTIKTRDWNGLARQRIKSVEEMRAGAKPGY